MGDKYTHETGHIVYMCSEQMWAVSVLRTRNGMWYDIYMRKNFNILFHLSKDPPILTIMYVDLC